MTKVKDAIVRLGRGAADIVSEFYVEAKRTAGGLSVIISGVIGIGELTGTCIAVSTHRARLYIDGTQLTLGVYENHTVEILGKVEDIRFVYGKN